MSELSDPGLPAADRAPAPDGLQLLPVTGLPEFRPGTTSPAAIADRSAVAARRRRPAGHLQDGLQGGGPAGAVARRSGRARRVAPQAHRRRDGPAGRAGRAGRRSSRTGSASSRRPPGVDASNVPADDIALLPADPDASAARLRAGLRRARSGRRRPHHRHPGPGLAQSASPTSRSARPGSGCWPTIAAASTRTATSCWSPRSPSATSWPPPATW